MIAILKCNRCVYRYTDIYNDDGQPCCEFFPDGIPLKVLAYSRPPEDGCINYIDSIMKCARCIHIYAKKYNKSGSPCCEAFPDGIPDEICSGNKIPEFNCNNDIGYIDILEQRHTKK